ncbi:MAG: hypothetical protein L3K13_05320 [Thermoplasmata archaeon]|nr:hypothetical protein [Thermoplasmata archaeon]
MGGLQDHKPLVALLLLGFVCVFLLTPAGFETRPIPSIHPLGFVVLVAIFSTVALNAAALLLLGRRPRLAATLVLPGFFLVLAGISVDQVGLFSSFRPPFRISLVEPVFVLIELGAMLFALRIFREGPPATASPR